MTYNRFFSLVFIFSLFTNIILSQEPVRCGTDEIHEFNLQNDEEYKRSYENLLQSLQSQTNTQVANEEDVYTIPVVVHILHDGEQIGEGSNLSDNDIIEAISSLNDDFAGTPWYVALNEGAPFYNDPVDIGVQFCLATVDPDGNPTNGITRNNPGETIPTWTNTGMVTTSLLDPCAEETIKEMYYWPTDEYCNIYICHKLNGGLSPLGFAYLPPTSNLRDGITIAEPVFGFGKFSSYDLNKTITHEMGHYLGLFHTFHNTSSCNAEINCAGAGDGLCDTPPTTGSSNCSPITCYETMTENFMDYSYDACMDRFSPDGRTRMRNQLLQYRSGLLDNGNCTPLDGVSVGPSSIIINKEGPCTESFDSITFTLNSNTIDTVNYVTINYQLDSEPSNSFVWSGLLLPVGNQTLTLPTLDIPFGEHTLSVWTELPNGVEDSYTINDTTILNFTNEPGTTVDITINLDALPRGFFWSLYEADDLNNPIGEVIDFIGSSTYDNNDYGCQSITYTNCLPEGNYVLTVDDLFENGLHYYCVEYEGPGSVYVISGDDTLTYVDNTTQTSQWDVPLSLNFSVPVVDIPTSLCLDLSTINSDYNEYNGLYSRSIDVVGTPVNSYPNNEYDLLLTANSNYTSWTGTNDLGLSGGIVFTGETIYKEYSPFTLVSGNWNVGETVRVKIETTYDTPNDINGVSVPISARGITWNGCINTRE